MKMKLALLGFGNVGQGLATILVEKREHLKEKYGFEFAVVGIYDLNMGGVCLPDGEVDLDRLLEIVRGGGLISDYEGADPDLDSLGLIEKSALQRERVHAVGQKLTTTQERNRGRMRQV